MSQLAVTAKALPPERAMVDRPGPGLRLVELETKERADQQQQRQAFWRRCEDIAWQLATSSAVDRAVAYESGTYTYRELSTASALRPNLMPLVNGEWEWIALTMADLE